MKSNVKKPVKKQVNKEIKQEESKKYLPVFPTITIIKTQKIDLNYFAIKKVFKQKISFIYSRKTPNIKTEKKLLDIRKIYTEYCKIWNYYINKEEFTNE